MGVELHVLVDHLEHAPLFVAAQVARAAGLKDPANAVSKVRVRRKEIGVYLKDVLPSETAQCPVLPVLGANGQGLRKDAVMLVECEVYDFLLHSRAPQTLPFRKRISEEVVPTIRKTGKYNAEQCTNPT